MASNYSLILFSRILDGFTGGNIAVARAYLTDITENNRSKAMAIIGIAFGTGFIFGPAIGSLCYGFQMILNSGVNWGIFQSFYF